MSGGGAAGRLGKRRSSTHAVAGEPLFAIGDISSGKAL